jgi:hypothetical protein
MMFGKIEKKLRNLNKVKKLTKMTFKSYLKNELYSITLL